MKEEKESGGGQPPIDPPPDGGGGCGISLAFIAAALTGIVGCLVVAVKLITGS